MLDMSKAIDTVNKKLLIDQLEKILEPDKMFLLSVLINETTHQIKVDKRLSEKIQTNIGIIQGDCLSANLFIFYLASCLKSPQAKINPNTEKKNVLAEQRKYRKLFCSPQASIRKLYYCKHNTPG